MSLLLGVVTNSEPYSTVSVCKNFKFKINEVVTQNHPTAHVWTSTSHCITNRNILNQIMKTTPDPVVDLAVIIPAFAPLARETVRLHPRQAQDGKAEVDVDASKIGGIFLWPDNEPWPHCTLCSENDGDAPRAYSPILQLNKRDVPELGFREGSDLFQLLWCPTDHNHDKTYCPRPMIVWRNRSDVGKFLTEIPKVEEQQYCSYIPKPCVIHPERVTEYPDMTEMEFQPDLLKLLESNGRRRPRISNGAKRNLPVHLKHCLWLESRRVSLLFTEFHNEKMSILQYKNELPTHHCQWRIWRSI